MIGSVQQPSRGKTRGRETAFTVFVEEIGRCCQASPGNRAERAIGLCVEAISAALSGPGAAARTLYASALLANLIKHQRPHLSYSEILEHAKRHAFTAFESSSIGKIQNYVESGRSFYRKVFDIHASLFRENAITDLRAILGSGALNYVTAIRDGLLGQIRRVCPDWSAVVDHVGPSVVDLDDAAWARSLAAIRAAEEHLPLDYLIGIGTQAAVMLKRHFPPRPDRQILFLGVTHPIAAGLVRRFEPPHDEPISGIAYCNGATAIIGRLRALFPRRSLAFVHKRGIPQDASLADEIGRMFPAINVIATADFPSIQDLRRSELVYFS